MMEIIKLAWKMILPFRDINFSTAASEDKRDFNEKQLSLSTSSQFGQITRVSQVLPSYLLT